MATATVRVADHEHEYQRALERAVRLGVVVLERGTGYDEPPALGTFGQGGAYRPEPPQYGAQRPSGPVSNF
jgi:hypothetical protein